MPTPRLLVIAAWLLGGCATVGGVAERTDLAPDWVEVHTPHLHLWIELDPPSAIGLARSMEAVRSALAAFWGLEFDPADRLEVVVFADRGSLTPYAGYGVGGYVVEAPSGPLLVMAANGVGGRAIASHELSHHLTAQALLRQPRWLGEGIATYLETAQIDPSGASVTFGKPPAGISPNELAANPLTLAQLWAWGSIDLTAKDAVRYYANAWWLVHHLIDARGAQFDNFIRLLAGGGDPTAAWAQAFAGLTDAELEAELATALARHELKNPSKPLQLRQIQPDAAPLTYAELYALKAQLLSRTTVPLQKDEWQRQIEDQLESALVLDDKNELALLLKSGLIREDRARIEFLMTVVAKLPHSGRALGDLGVSLGRIGKDSRSAFDRALELDPDDPVLINNAALQALLEGDPAKALELAQRAAALRPYSATIVDTYAAALAAVGRCSEAVDRAHQAIDLLGHTARSRPQLVARLHRYERDCGPGRPVAPTREPGFAATLQ